MEIFVIFENNRCITPYFLLAGGEHLYKREEKPFSNWLCDLCTLDADGTRWLRRMPVASQRPIKVWRNRIGSHIAWLHTRREATWRWTGAECARASSTSFRATKGTQSILITIGSYFSFKYITIFLNVTSIFSRFCSNYCLRLGDWNVYFPAPFFYFFYSFRFFVFWHALKSRESNKAILFAFQMIQSKAGFRGLWQCWLSKFDQYVRHWLELAKQLDRFKQA